MAHFEDGEGATLDDTIRTQLLGARTAHPPDRAQGPARLVIAAGPHAGRKFVIGDSLTVGRCRSCDIQLNDVEVSRRHCRIVRTTEGAYVLEDLESRNGTLVAGVPVGRHVLSIGDRIQVGRQTVLLFADHDPLHEALLQRQKMEALGQLGAGIAHDLNNLLGVLSASMQHLESLPSDRPLHDPEVSECHRDISTAIRSATDLTRRLLRFARRGEHSQSGPVDVTELCADVAHLIRRTSSHHIRVVPRIGTGLAARGDRAELHQAVLNLCLNARDAMPNGGVLRIDVDRVHAEDLPDVGLMAEGPLVVIAINDAGIGMDEQTRERVFEPFFTTKPGATGSGLGLSTVYEIVSSHGGHVSVESAPGCGSTFRVYLPAVLAGVQLERPEPRARKASSTEERAEAEPGRVLLVDDQALVLRAAARLLKSVGHDVICASNGADALDAFVSGPRPDVVLLDLDMPEMTGDECWNRLRVLDPSVRVLFLSGSCDETRRQALLRAGATGFLQKPVDAQVLRDAISHAMR